MTTFIRGVIVFAVLATIELFGCLADDILTFADDEPNHSPVPQLELGVRMPPPMKNMWVLPEVSSSNYTRSLGDTQVTAFHATTTGRRLSNEDAAIPLESLKIGGVDVVISAIFDGHSGNEVARYAALRLVDVLGTMTSLDEDEIVKTMQNLDDEILSSQEFDEAGSTAIVSVISKNNDKYRIHTINIGDSRSALVRMQDFGIKAIPMSVDHSLRNAAERQRIVDQNVPIVFNSHVARSNWESLAVTRALGDKYFKLEAAVLASASVQVHDAIPGDIILLACDGLFEPFGAQKMFEGYANAAILAGTIINRDSPSGLDAVEDIVDLAYLMGSLDNISATLIQLPHDSPQTTSSE